MLFGAIKFAVLVRHVWIIWQQNYDSQYFHLYGTVAQAHKFTSEHFIQHADITLNVKYLHFIFNNVNIKF